MCVQESKRRNTETLEKKKKKKLKYIVTMAYQSLWDKEKKKSLIEYG